MKTILRSLCVLLVVSVISCVTINIYFPAEELRGAADKIVNDVWGGEKTDSDTKAPVKTPGSSFNQIFSPTNAYAGQDINVSTPVIRAIKQSIKNRSGKLIPYLNTGNVGLSAAGLLKIRTLAGLNMKQKGELNKLVKQENQDRQRLYREIANANGFPDKVRDVQNIFAASWQTQAQGGWYLEKPDGRWVKK